MASGAKRTGEEDYREMAGPEVSAISHRAASVIGGRQNEEPFTPRQNNAKTHSHAQL
jgi:hypothetical protein